MGTAYLLKILMGPDSRGRASLPLFDFPPAKIGAIKSMVKGPAKGGDFKAELDLGDGHLSQEKPSFQGRGHTNSRVEMSITKCRFRTVC